MKRLIRYLSLFVMLAVLASCKKVTNGLNVSPNKPTDATINLLLNGIQVASIVSYEGNNARVAGIFSRAFTGSDRQYTSLNNYNTTASDYKEGWDFLYTNVIAQCYLVEAKALATNNKTILGIAQVMRAQALGLAADLWGDVPFKQVGNPDQFAQPKFDKQEDVYAGVQVLLDAAIINLSANLGASPGAKDIFYGGNNQQWIAAANTLKARFYLHTRGYANAIMYANQGIPNAAGDMLAKHGGTYQLDMNLYNSFVDQDRGGYLTGASAFAPALLQTRGETARLNALYKDAPGNNAVLNVEGFFGPSASFPLVTYSENQLILAEANLKKVPLDNSAALVALNNHRGYLNTIYGGYVNLMSADLNEILKERYITFIGQIEQFNDVRRTKNALGISPTVNTTTVLPQRFLYPQNELNTNSNTPPVSVGDLFKPTPVNDTPY